MRAGIFWTAALLSSSVVPWAAAQDDPQPHPPAAPRRFHVLRQGGSYLGVGVCEMDEDRARALKLKQVEGVEIKSVDGNSPAEKAGLKAGDVVLEYNGQKVEGNEQFARLVRETPAGRPAKLKVWRQGGAQTLTATIGTRPGGVFFDEEGEGLAITMPPMPKIEIPRIPDLPPMPDLPNAMLSWRSGALGIESESLSAQLAAFFGVKEGVLVRSVIPNSPAEKAGIKAGDVIVKVDGTGVSTPREISNLLHAARAKKTVSVTLVRDKRETTVSVDLAEAMHGRHLWPVSLTQAGV
ncbi:MAG TPA: PDZ domain-containing protein [Bryobacteraceae bacterium]|nr:PDZ domain-containing protein [Bryobacteraceae bacterium]